MSQHSVERNTLHEHSSMTRNLPVICSAGIIVSLSYYLFANILYANITYSRCGSSVPLPNGYSYVLPESGYHFFYKKGGHASRTASFYFINRIHVDDRYILGEVSPRPKASQKSNNNRDSKFNYFIIDTKAGRLSGEISEAVWKKELKKSGIRHVILEKRSDKWRYKMCSRYGRT